MAISYPRRQQLRRLTRAAGYRLVARRVSEQASSSGTIDFRITPR